MVGDFISGGATGWVFEHSREPDKVIKIMKAFPRVGTKVLDAFQYDDYLLDRHPMRYNANHAYYDHDWSVSMLWRPMSAKMQTYLFDELMAAQRMGMKSPSGIVKVYDSVKMELPLQFTKDMHEEIMTQDSDLADAWDDNFLSVKGPGHRNSYIVSMEKLRVPERFGRSRLRPRVEVFKEVADYLWNNFNLVTRDTASAGNYGFRANKELVIFDPIVSPLPFSNEWDVKDVYDRLRYNYFSYLFTEEPFPIDSTVEARAVNRKIKQIEKQLANNTFNTIERDAETFEVEGFPGSELDGTSLSDWSVRDIMYSTSVTGNFLEDQAKFNYGLNAESMYRRDSTYELYLRMPNGQEDILSRQNNFNMALAQMCGLILGNKVVYEIGIYGPRLADPYYSKDLLVRYKYGEFTGNDPDAVRLARDSCLEPKGFDSKFQEDFEAPAPAQTKVKFPRAKAEKIVAKVEAHLKPMVEKMMACGSYRRGAQMIGDIDFVIIPKEGYTLPQMLPPNEGINWVGDNKAQVIIDGEKVDFKVTTPAAWGATIMYFTGPADFNIKYRWMAKRKGLKLSEYGLFDRNTDQYLAGATEEDIFTALGRPYREPAKRQGFSKSKKKTTKKAETIGYSDQEVLIGKKGDIAWRAMNPNDYIAGLESGHITSKWKNFAMLGKTPAAFQLAWRGYPLFEIDMEGLKYIKARNTQWNQPRHTNIVIVQDIPVDKVVPYDSDLGIGKVSPYYKDNVGQTYLPQVDRGEITDRAAYHEWTSRFGGIPWPGYGGSYEDSFSAEDNYDATYGKAQAKIRRKLKKQIKAMNTHGTKAGQWSARKSQLLKQKYEAACERKGLPPYKGKKTSKQQDLSNWSKQKWGTASGRKSSVTGEPYFPAAAVKALKKKGLYAKATRQKRAATKAGKQRASYSKDIQNVVADYRAEFEAPYQPSQTLNDYTTQDLMTSSAITGDYTTDSLKYGFGPTALSAESQPPVCPICYNYIPNNQTPGAYPGALARYDNQTEICSECGTTEALVGMMAPAEVLSAWEQSGRSFKDYQQLIMNTKANIPEIMFGRGPEVEKLRKIQQEMDEKNSEILTEEIFESRRAVANTRETGYRSDYETPMAINLSYQNYHKPFEGIGSLFGAESVMECPPATQDVAINTKNRNATIKNFGYGPLNVDEPGDFWKDIAKQWNTTEEAAKKSKCGNCVAFDRSPRMQDCMPGETSDGEGVLGYCWMHHFKCHSARACNTWAAGGPIGTDEKSYEWQKRNLKAALDPDPIDPTMYKDE